MLKAFIGHLGIVLMFNRETREISLEAMLKIKNTNITFPTKSFDLNGIYCRFNWILLVT